VFLQVPSHNHVALLVLVYHWFQASTLHGLGPPSSHVVLISHATSCIHLDLLSKRISSPVTPMIDSVWKFIPGWRMSPLTVGYENVLFPFWAPARVVEPRGSNNEAHYNQSHEAQSDSTRWDVAHTTKGELQEGPKSCPPSNYPDILLTIQSMHRSSFLVLPLLS
jgi:hypothetical protein